MDISFINSLEQRLLEPLPGIEAQAHMAPVDHRLYLEPHDNHKVASVMLLLYPKNEEWNICYIRRSSKNPEDRHAGQISFPGGKLEEIDTTLEDCALRETYEEIGISPDKVGILGALSELYISVSRFKVYPFIGFMESASDFILQESEVNGIIEVPLNHLSNENLRKKGEIKVGPWSRNDIPYFDLYGEKLWGATAMITSEFLNIYNDIKVSL
jgi:8-oxo-dGTP pyrophosphatase MutT (NUDIX family)